MNKSDSFIVLREAITHLTDPAQWLGAQEIMALDASCQPHVDALMNEYVHKQEHNAEFEKQFWQTLDTYLLQLNSAYTLGLQEMAANEDGEVAGKVLQHRMAILRIIAQTHFLRYRPLPDNFWSELQVIYQMAEQVKEINAAGTSCDAEYLQTLMLGAVNRTHMLKWEMVMVNNWLGTWSKGVALSKEYDEKQHVYCVDLLEDRGARLMRDYMPSLSYRYWHLDGLTAALLDMRQQLQNNILPADFTQKTSIKNALSLVGRLLAEWSQVEYRRQRRDELREGVNKSAQVVHGIFNVCQHVKNLAYSNVLSISGHHTDDYNVLEIDDMATSQANNWQIENESNYGFGAVVNSELNLWLKPGRLIALDYEFNPDMTVVGVVRSIQQQFSDDCYVGIEVLSHTPSYVRLVHLSSHEADAARENPEPFPALFFTKDESQAQAASLVMPSLQHIASGFYQLKIQKRVYFVRLGEVIEQRDDWIRTGLEII